MSSTITSFSILYITLAATKLHPAIFQGILNYVPFVLVVLFVRRSHVTRYLKEKLPVYVIVIFAIQFVSSFVMFGIYPMKTHFLMMCFIPFLAIRSKTDFEFTKSELTCISIIAVCSSLTWFKNQNDDLASYLLGGLYFAMTILSLISSIFADKQKLAKVGLVLIGGFPFCLMFVKNIPTEYIIGCILCYCCGLITLSILGFARVGTDEQFNQNADDFDEFTHIHS